MATFCLRGIFFDWHFVQVANKPRGTFPILLGDILSVLNFVCNILSGDIMSCDILSAPENFEPLKTYREICDEEFEYHICFSHDDYFL